jgi:adenylylsulfate reductase subunit B
MAILVDEKKCTGCGACVICPGDLMALNKNTRKAYIKEQRDCWNCMACVKECPVGALTLKLPYQLANYKATLMPEVFEDHIKWTLTDMDGNKEEFVIKTLEKRG